jgi:chromosome segregation and condensation protein ScpB
MTFIPKWAIKALYKESKFSQEEIDEVRGVNVVKIQQKQEKREIIRIKKKLGRPFKDRE